METIRFMMDDGTMSEELYVVEQTMLNGMTYLLVSDTPKGEGNAWILKDVSAAEDETASYEEVENDTEWQVVADIFQKMMEEDADVIL